MAETLKDIRHLAKELLALAVLDFFPGTLLAGGDVTSLGFYYDFAIQQPIDDKALPLLEEKLRGLIKRAQPLHFMEMMRDNAAVLLNHHHQPLRAEAAALESSNVISVLKIAGFYDLCPLLSLETTLDAGVIRLLKIDVLDAASKHVRIEGVAFPEMQSMKKFLKRMQRAKEWDHELIGREMRLFEKSEDGWFWLPKGMVIREQLIKWWEREHRDQGFRSIQTPVSSSHARFQAELFKKMDCSSEDLPLKICEVNQMMMTQIPGGQIEGLFSSRGAASESASVFCLPAKVEDEIISSLHFILKWLKISSFEGHWVLYTKKPKAVSYSAPWEAAVRLLQGSLMKEGIQFTIDREVDQKEGPRVEMLVEDSLGREWVGPSLGVDVIDPVRLQLSVVDDQGKSHMPVMLVRSLFGTLERAIALMLEKGPLPFWLMPEHVRILPLGAGQRERAVELGQAIAELGCRVDIDNRNVKLAARIHRAEKERIPFIAIIGEKEEKAGMVSVRSAQSGKSPSTVKQTLFFEQLCEWKERCNDQTT